MQSATAFIDAKIGELGDWRGRTLARMRALIHEAEPAGVEEWKWRGTPVWSHTGMVCTGETYKSVVKLTFAHGASLADPAGLFNSSLGGGVRRAIDLHEGAALDETAFKQLIRAAVERNLTGKGKANSTKASSRRSGSLRRSLRIVVGSLPRGPWSAADGG